MNYRLNGRIIAVVAVLVVAAIALFVYTLMGTPISKETAQEVDTTPPVAQEERVITGKHQYVDGMHTVAGMLTVPSACHSVVVEPFFLEDATTPTVELRFTILLETECEEQVVSDAPYRVTFDAPEDVQITATLDGLSARLNLVPAAPGESLDETYYFKG